MRGFPDCYEGSKEAGMVCADGVYELGAIDGIGGVTVSDPPSKHEHATLLVA